MDDPAGSSGGRVRRRTVKSIDYSKEQEFSDEDVFEEDEEEREPVVSSSKSKRGRPRKSVDNDPDVGVDMDVESTAYKPPKPVFTEKGYDMSQLPIRERFTFMPEYEPDGSPRIELIVGRRPIDEKNDGVGNRSNEANEDEEPPSDDIMSDGDAEKEGSGRRKTRRQKQGKGKQQAKEKANSQSPNKKKEEGPVEYEYLVKFKGRSYLHLEWMTGADLESMNKSAKTIYRRYLKKLAAGLDDELEDPNFDPSYAEPQKVVDEREQEITVELSDRELLEWEKEREKALAEEEDDEDSPDGEGKDTKMKELIDGEKKNGNNMNGVTKEDGEDAKATEEAEDDWDENEKVDFNNISMDKLRKIVERDGNYYPVFPGCDNPYRDGHVTEPPKKPRASYLFFQATMRSYFVKRNPGATQAEIMKILGDQWQTMSDKEQAPFIQLAREEAIQYEKERALLAKAQKPNEMWQPLRRCMMVLDRVCLDSFASVFMEPVDTEEFTDYDEIIDHPMDLGTVRKKLTDKKYQAPEQFARDVRRVWSNCKIYNSHGSAIWHVADYMSKQFERLYHAWVLEFRERYLRWVHPKSRPWEHSCRQCDGKCETPDDKMVLCDHCDAMYGMQCLTPPLKKLPKGVWHCPDCLPKVQSVKGVRMLSAVAEQAARKRAELGDTPKRKIKQTMYLIKWAGLGYEFCTWETRDDVPEALINDYHRLNNTFPDEPDLPEEDVTKLLEKVTHVNPTNAGGSYSVPELRSQLYAQSRALQFVKFGQDLPERLGVECGAKTTTATTWEKSDHPKEVIECVAELSYRVATNSLSDWARVNASLPPLMTGEYDAVVPITSKGLMMNVGEIHGSVAFLGYRTFPDGSKGPAELCNLIRNVGDKIVAVDGVSTINKSFKDVILMLRESGKNKFAFMRFLENKYAVCSSDLASVGSAGRYAIEELHKKFSTDRQRLLVQRRKQLIEDTLEDVEAQESDDSVGDDEHNSDDESDDGSEGEFQPDSEDEELMRNPKVDPSSEPISTMGDQNGGSRPFKPVDITMVGEGQQLVSEELGQKPSGEGQPANPEESKQTEETAEISELIEATQSGQMDGTTEPIVIRQETTRSLAFRLLDAELCYSSDEGGMEDWAYFVDGVDATFTTKQEAGGSKASTATADRKKPRTPVKKETADSQSETVPVKRNDFSMLGERSKLLAATALTTHEPNADDFSNFPNPPEGDEAKEVENLATELESPSAKKSTKRSTVKVEQLNATTSEVIRVWANAEVAAATLQIPLVEIRQVLKGEYDEDLGDEVGGYRWRYALAGAEVTAPAAETNSRSKKGREAWLEFRDKLYDPSDPHVYKNGNRLRDYQVDGVNWLASTWYKRHGCILADEMGLGKTIQIIAYIEHLYRVEKIHRPFLVVVPLSTVEHWRREFEGWTDMTCCVYHDRQRVWRDVMREYEWYYADRPHTADYLKFDVLVTTYDTLIGDFDVISQIPWRVAVVDEAHRLRNQKGKLLECMKEISAKGTLHYGFQSRVLMSGTPLQNDLNELWTLLNFIEPFKFPDLGEFQVSFGNMASREQVEALQLKISPFMLRRVKEDVAKDIPAKEETVIDVELTSIQKQYYRAIFEHNHAFLAMGTARTAAPKLMNIQMELRKCCNHPYLLEGVEHRESDKQYKELSESGALDGKSPEEQQQMLNEHGYIKTSGKMVLLDKLLPKLRQEGHKVLIFSQMVRMLDLISEYCEFRNFRYERLDGRVRGSERQKAIDRFEREEDSFVFLLSTRAGGVGINLTAADICIIFDSDWNPQNDIQAQARCHRIGQTRDVMIYRLITSRSFEQEMFDRASRKLGLEQAVLGSFGQDNEDDKPSQKEMEQLLKRGAYALLEDENDDVGNQFCADDIENILAKRTRTRVVEGTKTASWLNKQGLVVSKSKFTSESGTADLDVDDPDFWLKVMPDFVTPTIMLQKLDDLSSEIEGTSAKGRGRGRGRGRGHKKQSEGKTEEDQSETPAVPEGGEADKVGTVADMERAGVGMETLEADIETSEAQKDGAVVEKDGSDAEKPAEGVGNEPDENEGGSDDENDVPVEDDDVDEDEDGNEKESNHKLSRTNQKKVLKFISELKGMMQGIFDEADDDALAQDEKASCQKLLLTMSVKERLFNEEQRHMARAMLKRLEGDRRRRCRTSEQPSRFSPGRRVREEEDITSPVREELLIIGKKQRRKRRKKAEIELDLAESDRKRPKRGSGDEENGRAVVGDDGYLHHSDSEADWSDVGEELYQGGRKRNEISRKEAKRRRTWAADDDAATAAGRPWPVFPRHYVAKVLTTVLDEMIKHDKKKGGLFSEPVPPDDFPEYYEQIKNPMDYGTMKEKLERGEYRSAQAMQKDFVLVMQNCLQFNAPNSDIVKEARQQALMRPEILRKAAMQHNLFLAEDGSVLEILDDNEKDEETGEPKIKKRKRRTKQEMLEAKAAAAAAAAAGVDSPIPRKKKGGKRKRQEVEEDDDDELGDDQSAAPVDDDDIALASLKKKKPRIKISLPVDDDEDADSDAHPTRKKKVVRRKKSTDPAAEADEKSAGPKKKRRKVQDVMDASDDAPISNLMKIPKKTGKLRKMKKAPVEQEDAMELDQPVANADVEASNDKSDIQVTEQSPDSSTPVYLDVAMWKKEREALDGTFTAARAHFVKRGPWEFPSALGDDRFGEVAVATMSKMDRHDRYDVFARAVTEEEAPGYYEIIKKPMDFGKMREKAQNGDYGSGSAAASLFYNDFLLVFDNCLLYNDEEGEVVEEAARMFGLLPETYVGACAAALKKKK